MSKHTALTLWNPDQKTIDAMKKKWDLSVSVQDQYKMANTGSIPLAPDAKALFEDVGAIKKFNK